jgi:hypothetical protein
VIFKIFTKVFHNRTVVIVDEIIFPSQHAFIKGRFILDGILLLHETHYELKMEKTKAVLSKLFLKNLIIK